MSDSTEQPDNLPKREDGPKEVVRHALGPASPPKSQSDYEDEIRRQKALQFEAMQAAKASGIIVEPCKPFPEPVVESPLGGDIASLAKELIGQQNSNSDFRYQSAKYTGPQGSGLEYKSVEINVLGIVRAAIASLGSLAKSQIVGKLKLRSKVGRLGVDAEAKVQNTEEK